MFGEIMNIYRINTLSKWPDNIGMVLPARIHFQEQRPTQIQKYLCPKLLR